MVQILQGRIFQEAASGRHSYPSQSGWQVKPPTPCSPAPGGQLRPLWQPTLAADPGMVPVTQGLWVGGITGPEWLPPRFGRIGVQG